MAACRNPQRIGEELFPPTPTRQDTLRIEGVRQVFLPPPSTKKAPFVFMGEAEDTFTGRWKAGWATSFALGGKDVKFFSQTLVAVDSVILELFIASAYGDFSVPMRVRVERLTQPLSNAQSYTTTATFSTDGQNLVLPGRDSLYFISLRPGGYRIPLDTNLGRSILTLPASALSGEEAFQQAFPGLYITAEPMVAGAKAAIYTIFPRSASTVLRIFYRERVQGQDAPQRYDFFVNDSCVWAYSLQRQSTNTLRDHLEQDTTLWAQQLLVAGGLPVGIQFEVSGWEALSRRPVLAARLIWFSDSVGDNSYSPFYPRPTSFVLYADTIEEAASAAWGFGDYTNASVIWELTQPIQEIALRRRLPPKHFYIWLSGRSYTLQRWLAAGLRSSHPPYLIVTSAEP
ncbi:MAG: DUF4270 domain-containing protein [Bacteroidia bacterium]|nr:DUF4270 domain-containing protein [Bacteroidia bacterium]MCX7764517.1 DUF4270 domain-containing protein [Bacteroidia bacterium]MDW8057984.1 DUF4270 family protein [Bacteroidia bacterium]